MCVCVYGGGTDNVCFSHQRISKSAVWTSLEKQLYSMGPIASRGVSKETYL